ncbi:hypothetical protein BLA28_06105 [Eisenbergiella tayi]|nr:hypothetical protein BEI62_19045 [Eisenbergiella tayi]OIZ66505.1 hypothetical protein BLA28_06105 [Eisenbergiella tayi]
MPFLLYAVRTAYGNRLPDRINIRVIMEIHRVSLTLWIFTFMASSVRNNENENYKSGENRINE